jgi:hypothetical protein
MARLQKSIYTVRDPTKVQSIRATLKHGSFRKEIDSQSFTGSDNVEIITLQLKVRLIHLDIGNMLAYS